MSGVDALGTTTVLTRDGAGNVVREEILSSASVLLRRTEFAYDAMGNKRSETLFRTIDGVLVPVTTQYGYDASNRLTSITDPLGGTSRSEYDAAGRVSATIDPLGRRTEIAYDTLGFPVRTTFPDGTFELMSYDLDGNAQTQTDRAGRVTSFAYDELGRLVRTTLPDGSFTRTVYSAGGRIAASIDARGNRTDFDYDAAGRGTATTFPPVANGAGGPMVRPRITRTLDALGAIRSKTDANGRTTLYNYDAAGRLVRIDLPDGSSVTQTFDALGRRTSVTDEDGRSTTYGYDGLSRLVSVSGAAGDASYTYDEAGNLLTQTDALGRVSRFRYDAGNRLVERQFPGGESVRFVHDAAGNPVARTDPNSATTTLVFDAMNRPVRKIAPGGGTVDFAYTADGKRKTVTDARGATTYYYDAIGRLAAVRHPTGESVGYARDANGNLLSLQSPAATSDYAYDALDRLIELRAPEGITTYAYDLVGNRLRSTAASGVITDYTYDTRDRPAQLTHSAGVTVLQSFANVFSAAGRLTKVTESDGSIESFGYDGKGRVTSQVRTGTNPLATSHVYDLVGNRVQTTRAGVSTNFTYDSNDRLQSDGTSTYQYDANGNLVARTGGGASVAYGYDGENQLRTLSVGGTTTRYDYDAAGNRVQVLTPSGMTRLLVDGGANNSGLSQVLEERDGAGTLQARYTYGNELVAMTRGAATSVHLRDARRSVRGLASGAGALTDTYQYDAYGALVGGSGSAANPYRFAGERFDAESGLYQLRARYYEPATGRFLSRDPARGAPDTPVSRHRYLYANADPVNASDPTGRETLIELSFTQALDATMRNIEALKLAQTVCTLGQQLDVAGNVMLWGGLSAGVIAASIVYGGVPGKTAFSVIGVNPVRLKRSSLKSVELRWEPPDTAKFVFTDNNGRSTNASIGSKGTSLGLSGKLHSYKFEQCGLEVGAANLKWSTKGSGKHGDLGVGAALSVEIEAIKIFRVEYPILEFGYSTNSGLDDKALGVDLLSLPESGSLFGY